MNFWEEKFTEWEIYFWETVIDEWFFYFAMAFLAFELVRLVLKKTMTWNILGDTITNFLTLVGFLGIGFLTITAYLAISFYFYENFALTYFPINFWTIAIAIVIADFAYYWEHRAMHRIGIGWATHTVHHSSPYFNISVAYRFGPLDGIIPIFFHVPMVMLGFHPFLILFAEAMVQLYQTALHTETIGKFPKPIEAIMNTPSHHRVHHGSNPQYIDKNYAGIFIIWDRLFGTFEEEQEKVVYGVIPPIQSVNPFYVFFHGFGGLAKKVMNAKGFGNKIAYLAMPPEWSASNEKKQQKETNHE